MLDKEMSEAIVQLAAEKKPDNVEQLVILAEEKLSVPKVKIIECVLQLQDEGVIVLKKPVVVSSNLLRYLKTAQARWYWLVMTLSAATLIVAFTVPENAYPLAYMRISLGILFILWLPGHSFMRAVFPRFKNAQESAAGLDYMETVALSIGLSLVLVPVLVLLLHYTPWGIRLTSILITLSAFTAICATTAIVSDYQANMRASA